jgi:hypothetical protein
VAFDDPLAELASADRRSRGKPGNRPFISDRCGNLIAGFNQYQVMQVLADISRNTERS